MSNTPDYSQYRPVILINLNTAWEKMLHLGVPVSFVPRQIISAEVDGATQGFYYVRRGRVRLSYIASNGQEKVLFYVGKGTLFHDVPAIVKSTSCIFTCMDATSAVFFNKKMLSHKFISEHPEIITNWVESIAEKSTNFFHQLCGFGLLDSFANVCRLLYSMALYNREGDKIVPYLSKQECAALLGIHRASLHKALTRLQKEEIIGKYSRHELEILDMDKLESYGHG